VKTWSEVAFVFTAPWFAELDWPVTTKTSPMPNFTLGALAKG